MSILKKKKKGLKYFKVGRIRNGGGLQGQSAPGLTDRTDADGPLRFDQKVVDLVHDFVHLPDDGRGRIDDDLAA